MQESDIQFLENSFKKYYFDHFDLIQVPERAPEREFGYQKFNSGMIRHIPIKDGRELRLLLMQNTPSDVYCSNGYYTFPNLPMNEKDWKGADLIFDIDAKDLSLPCRDGHTVSVCNNCKKISKQSFSQCIECGSNKLEKKSLPCKNCMAGSKKEAEKLLDVLTNDMGISKEDIHVYFSGNEGFHVHVYDLAFQKLGRRERSDLTDYVLFKGIIPETFGIGRYGSDKKSFPDFGQEGWRERFSAYVFGSKSKRSKILAEILADGYPSFQKMLDDAAKSIGVKIDPNVTADIHRVFRLPGSINSKSGLSKIQCQNLAKFDPYCESSFLGDETVEILASCPVEFRLKNKKFGPYDNEKVTVPTYAAAYMICKKLATMP